MLLTWVADDVACPLGRDEYKLVVLEGKEKINIVDFKKAILLPILSAQTRVTCWKYFFCLGHLGRRPIRPEL